MAGGKGIQMPTVDSERENLKTMLREVRDGGHPLTDWEENFVNDLLLEFEDPEFDPSPQQRHKILQIYGRYS